MWKWSLCSLPGTTFMSMTFQVRGACHDQRSEPDQNMMSLSMADVFFHLAGTSSESAVELRKNFLKNSCPFFSIEVQPSLQNEFEADSFPF